MKNAWCWMPAMPSASHFSSSSIPSATIIFDDDLSLAMIGIRDVGVESQVKLIDATVELIFSFSFL